MDPEASKALFDEEVKKMRSMAMFRDSARRIVSADFPDLVLELPHPSGQRRLFRFRCDNWNAQPPSVKAVDNKGSELVGVPEGNYFTNLSTGWGLCAPGTREYHGHHQENSWANYQGKLNLSDIVAKVATFYISATKA